MDKNVVLGGVLPLFREAAFTKARRIFNKRRRHISIWISLGYHQMSTGWEVLGRAFPQLQVDLAFFKEGIIAWT